MSWTALTWAENTRGHRNSNQKQVLRVLAAYCHDRGGSAEVSQQVLAACARSYVQLILHLTTLESDGYIAIEEGAYPGRYRLRMENPNGIGVRVMGEGSE